ncbi:MAG: hypothetical protein IT290_06585 [Deltaproteobacteria bacterium]|nr:hypothetical protein [Deltaproteobacteria bacterium]
MKSRTAFVGQLATRAVFTVTFVVGMNSISAQIASAQVPAPAPTAIPSTPGDAPAEDAAKDEGKLQPGVIASYGNFPKRTAVNVSGDASPGDAQSAILARVSRKGSDSCEAVVSNSNKESGYSVSFDIVGSDTKGAVVLRRNFSASIPAGGSVSRSVSCRKDLNMQVILKSGSKS